VVKISLIGLDIGTTGCKCTLFDLEGNIVCFSYEEYKTENPKPGYYELNPENVWNLVKTVIYNTINSYKGEPVTAICISSFGEAAVPVDSHGNVLGNSILYMDKRGSEQSIRLEKELGKRKVMELTGVPIHPMYTIGKIMWIKENMPDIFNKVWKFMLFGDFISFCLTGLAVIDYSLASRTMAFNVIHKKWEEKILRFARIKQDMFSKPCPSGTIIGNVKRDIAEELGIPQNALVVVGGHDQACAALGAGILSEGLAIDGIGTVECITPAFDKPVLNELMLKYNFNCAPHLKEGMYVTYAFNFTGGSLLKWYRDNFISQKEEITVKRKENIYALLDTKAPKIPTDLLVLPHFAGAGTPYMDTSAKGAIIGLSFNNKAPEIYRAILEGITYEMAFNMECLDKAGIKINKLRAVGGGAKSDLWLQIKADIMQCKIERLNVSEAGTLGTAIMAGVATGAFTSIEDASKKIVKVSKEFYPNTKFREKYIENYNRYKRVYKNIKDIYKND
jgi:xylulokinase